MATVTVPASFFRSELVVYRDWRQGLAREMIQNSVDADGQRIQVRFEDVDGHGRVVFRDYGHGMSRAVLEDVFFALGATTKGGGDTIGGFGRARIIVCFAQHAYRIHTGRLLVTGAGGEYTITETDEHLDGCEFTVDLIDSDSRRARTAFLQVLADCALPIPVYLDGQRMGFTPLPERAARVLRDEDGRAWARVYVRRSSLGRALVRVRGLPMFSRWLPGNEDVIVELVPARAREVLTASRDGLGQAFDDQLTQFCGQLAANRRKALAPAAVPLDLRVAGGGWLLTAAPADPAAPEPAAALVGLAAGPAVVEAGAGRLVPVRPVNAPALAAAASSPGQLTLVGELEEPASPAVGCDVFLLADTSDGRVRKLARDWSPATWAKRGAGRRHGLLLAWQAALGYVLDVFVHRHPDLGEIRWAVGWTFDEDARALHKSVSGGHVLALNPVTASGAIRYRPSRRTDRAQLLALAAHEVCHVLAEDHDERFASLLTDLFGALDMGEADRVVRAARLGATG